MRGTQGSSTALASKTGGSRRSARAEQSSKRLVQQAITILLVGLSLSVAASIFTNGIDREREQQRFEQRMAVLAKRFEHDMLLPLEILHGLAGLFESSDQVTEDEFGSFARSALERHPHVSGLLWVPRVEHIDRAAVVTRMRGEIPDFEIRERLDKPGLVAGERETYHPILFIEPMRPGALGLDLGGDPVRRAWIDEAHRNGLFVTPRVELPAEGGTEAAVGAYVPVRKKDEPIGVVIASFRMAQFVEAVFTAEELNGVDLMLYEAKADAVELVYSTAGEAVETQQQHGRYEQDFQLGNRTWSLVFQGTDALGTRMPVAVMIGGTISSALASILFYLFSRLRSLGEGARRLGQYELLEVLGEGGMGTVYRAHHMLLRRPTAVKVIRVEVANRGSMRERFEREVNAASRLSHPNNIVVYDYGSTPEGELYYAMEYVDGIDLHRLVDRFGPMPSNRVAHTLVAVSGALAEAHAHGIVHRDIKPANIMLSRRGGLFDFPKVLDFGLALTRSTAQRDITLDGTLLGTPHFMAPEQGLGTEELTPAADVYAVGCVAYYLLTGHNLFEAPTVRELVGKHMTAPPIPVGELASQEVDPELAELVMRCLDKTPLGRPTTTELAKAVAACAATWTNDDAAAWWEEHLAQVDVASPSTRQRLLTVRLHDRAASQTEGNTTAPIE